MHAVGIGAIVDAPVLVLSDLGGWVVGVFQRIGDVSVYWLVLALALKTSESAFIGLAWRNILRPPTRRAGCASRRPGPRRKEERRSTRSRLRRLARRR
jgi:hypothetical protein